MALEARNALKKSAAMDRAVSLALDRRYYLWCIVLFVTSTATTNLAAESDVNCLFQGYHYRGIGNSLFNITVVLAIF